MNSQSQRPNHVASSNPNTTNVVGGGMQTGSQSMQSSQAGMTSSFKMTHNKKQSKALALRQQQQSQNVSIRDVVNDNNEQIGIKQLQLQLIPHSNNILGLSHDGARSFKMPQRPETSTGSKSKQMILMHYQNQNTNASNTLKTKTLQQVYGQPQVVIQQRRNDITQDSSGSNTRGKGQQLRASSQTNIFNRGNNHSYHQAVTNNNSRISGQSSGTPAEVQMIQSELSNVYVNMNEEYEQPNVLTMMDEGIHPQQQHIQNNQLINYAHTDTTQTLTDSSPGKNRKQFNQQLLNMQNKMIIGQGKFNKKGEPVVIPSKLDLNQLMYFNGSQQFTDTRINSAALSDLPSGHIINTGHQIQPETTPQSISFKAAQSNNSKKLRNLKNFSAQSAIDSQQAAFNSINHKSQKVNNMTHINSANKNDQIPEFQHNILIKQDNVNRQLSSKNMRRNTQTNHSKNGAPNNHLINFQIVQNAERAGSRYKINKQQSHALQNAQNQYTQKQSPNTKKGVAMNKSVNYNNNNNSVTRSGVGKNALILNMNPLMQSQDNHSVDKRISSYQSSNQHRAVNMVNKSRQSLKEIGDKSFEHQKDNHMAQSYQSQQKPHGQNFNLLRHSVQQDNFLSSGSDQVNNMMVMAQYNNNKLGMQLTHGASNLQKNSQVQQALSKSTAIQKQSNQKYQQQRIQQQTHTSLNRDAIMQLQTYSQQQSQNSSKLQKHMVLRNQQQTTKTPQITSQKNGNFSRKLTINSNNLSISNTNGDIDIIKNPIDVAQQIQNLHKNTDEIKSLKGTLLQASQSPTFIGKEFQINGQSKNLQQQLNQQFQQNKRNERYVKSGKGPRTNNQNIEMINAASNYIEAPLKIGSIQACLSPQNIDELDDNREYIEEQIRANDIQNFKKLHQQEQQYLLTKISQQKRNITSDLSAARSGGCASQLTSGTNISQSAVVDQQFPIQFNPQHQESRYTPSTFNNEILINNTLDGVADPLSQQRQIRMSGQASPQKLITMNSSQVNKNKTESRQSKRQLVNKNRTNMDAQSQARQRQKQKSVNEFGPNKSNRNTSIARRHEIDEEDFRNELLYTNQLLHAQSVSENPNPAVANIINNTHQIQKIVSSSKNKDMLVQSANGKHSLFQIYNQPIKVVTSQNNNQANLLQNKKNKKSNNQQQLKQKLQAQELQKYLAQQQQLALQNQQLSTQQSHENIANISSNFKYDQNGQQSKSFGSAQRKKKIVYKVVGNQQIINQTTQGISGSRQSNITQSSKSKKDIFQKIKQQQKHLKEQNQVDRPNIPSKSSVFDNSSSQVNQSILRISHLHNNIPEFQQMIQMPRTSNMNNTKESERVDNLFLINTSQQRECSTSPSRQFENNIRSPDSAIDKQNISGYNISELYDPDIKSSQNDRVNKNRVNVGTKNGKQKMVGQAQNQNNRSDWRRRSSNNKNIGQQQVRQSNIESQYRSNVSGRNATYTSSFESGSQQVTDPSANQQLLNRKSTSSHMVSKNQIHKQIIQKTRTTGNESKIVTPNNESSNHIKIQNNNFQLSVKQVNSKEEPELLDDIRDQKNNNSLRISKPTSNMGLNSKNDSQGRMVKNSQSQKRISQQRKQMNKNRLKELPTRIHESTNESAKSTQKIKGNQESTEEDNIFQRVNSHDPSQISPDKDQQRKVNQQNHQIKKPPQVPSLGTKIQYAQQKQISQLPEAQIFSDEVSAGVSAISTIGGTAANAAQNAQGTDGQERNGVDYLNSNKMQNRAFKNDQEIYRKNSSILSTANRNYFQINTPSALGYTSVLLGGTTQTAGGTYNRMQVGNSFTLYGNIQYHDDPDVFAEQLVFDEDRELLDQFKFNEGVKLSVDPLGSSVDPFMALPYEGPLLFQNYFTENILEPEIQMDSDEKNLELTDTQDARELRDKVEPMSDQFQYFFRN